MEDGNQDSMLAKSKKEEEDNAYLKSLSDGYHFKPRDEELLGCYLRKKVNNEPLPANRIKVVQLYQYNPETLTAISKNKSFNGVVNEWYYFTLRERKYRNGRRPGRGASNGVWKATCANKPVKYKGKLVGFKKTLVFYKGKPLRGEKTSWIMHEYVLSDPPATQRTGDNDMQLDKWVLCRVYKKQKDGDSKPETSKQGADQEDEEAEDPIFPAQTETQNQESRIQPQTEAQNHQEHGIFPQTETQNQEYCFPSPQAEAQNQEPMIQPQTEAQHHQEHGILPQTETQNQGYWIQQETQNQGNWIPHPEPVQQFQVQNFRMLPQAQQACPMPPFYDNAYQNSTFGRLPPQFPESFDARLNHDRSTMFPQQAAVSGYGCFRPTVPPSSFVPPTPAPPSPDDQLHFMGQNNLNLHNHRHHHQQQQQQFPDAQHNYDFSVDDIFLLNADFGLPKHRDLWL